MSQPYTNIKEAIESVGKYTEHPRPSINWFDALDDCETGKPKSRIIADLSPAAISRDRPYKKNKPKASICRK